MYANYFVYGGSHELGDKPLLGIFASEFEAEDFARAYVIERPGAQVMLFDHRKTIKSVTNVSVELDYYGPTLPESPKEIPSDTHMDSDPL